MKIIPKAILFIILSIFTVSTNIAAEIKVNPGEVLLPSGAVLLLENESKNIEQLKSKLQGALLKIQKFNWFNKLIGSSNVQKQSLTILTPGKAKSVSDICDEYVAKRLQVFMRATGASSVDIKLKSPHKKFNGNCIYNIKDRLFIVPSSPDKKINSSVDLVKHNVTGVGEVHIANMGYSRSIEVSNVVSDYLVLFDNADNFKKNTIKIAHHINKYINDKGISSQNSINRFHFSSISKQAIGYELPALTLIIRPSFVDIETVIIGGGRLKLVQLYKKATGEKTPTFIYTIDVNSDNKKSNNVAKEIMGSFGVREAERLKVSRVKILLYYIVNFEKARVVRVVKLFEKKEGKWTPVSSF